MKSIAASSLSIILSSALGLQAAGQNFQRRYDALGQFRAEGADGVEVRSNGESIVFVSAQRLYDSLLYSSVLTTIRIDGSGSPIDTEMVFIPLTSTYSGWSATSFPLWSGGYGVGGSTNDNVTIRPALYLFDSLGHLTLFQEYGIVGESWLGRNGVQCPDGGYVIAGETNTSGPGLDAFLLKLDSLGNEQWVQLYGLPNGTDYISSVRPAPHGGYYIAGSQEASPGAFDPWIVHLDSLGALVWDEHIGTPYNDYFAACIELTSAGNLICATGWTMSSGSSLSRLTLAMIDSSGTLLWSNQYDIPALNAVLLSVDELTTDGDLIAAGISYRPGYLQGALLRTDALGDSIWLRYYHYYDSLWTEGKGAFWDVTPTYDGGFVAVGEAYGSNNPADTLIAYSQDTWVVKVDSMGCLVPGCDGISTITSQITNYRDALRVAPNPAHGSTQLRWHLPQALTGKGGAVLSVVDAQSRAVRTEALDLPSGTHELDVSALPPGLYHLHVVQAGTWVTGAKLIVE